MNRRICLLGIAAVLMLSSCGTLRRLRSRDKVRINDTSITAAVQLDTPVNSVIADSPLVMGPVLDTSAVTPPGNPELADDSRMVMPFWMVPLSYTTFSGKAKAHIESPGESRDFTLTVRIESGKRIWMSVVGSALGISVEAFRAILTPDSMVAINRIDKEVIRAPFADIAALFPVQGDFHALEAVLTGGKVPAVNELSHVSVDPSTGDFSVSGSSGATTQTLVYSLRDSTMIRQELVQAGATTDLRYSGYVPAGERRFAQSRQILLRDGNGDQTLSLEFTSYSFDEPVDMPLSIPEKYKRR